MVRVSSILARVPVIKFRKGGVSQPSRPTPTGGSCPAPSAAQSAAPAAASATPQIQSSAPMSTSSVPDIDLPLRYRRLPLSQEEIDHINGGGIV